MNARKNADVNMIDVCLSFLNKKRAEIIVHAPAIGDDMDTLIALRQSIAAALGKSQVTTTGLTQSKADLKSLVLKTAGGLIAAGIAAMNNRNAQLVTEFKDFNKKLKNPKDADVSVFCGNLLTSLKENVAHLAGRGVTLDTLTTFEALIEQFKVASPEIKGTIKDMSLENTQAQTLIAEARTIIDVQIGGTLFHIKDNIQAIYAGFLKASTVQKPQTASTQFQFNIVDDVTNQPVGSAQIDDMTIMPIKSKDNKATGKRVKVAKTPKKALIHSTIKGEAFITKAATQTKTLAITAENYQPLQLTLPNPKRGKVNLIEVRLMPIVV